MSLELALQLVETAAVVIGVAFGLAQLRQLRLQREVQAGLDLLAPLQTAESADSLLLMHRLPDGLSGADLRKLPPDQLKSMLATLAMFESLGPLVARGHVPIDMYAEFYRGPTLLSWRKFRRFIEEERAAGWHSLYEWLQWLAERMEERSLLADQEPAHIRFAGWRKSADFTALAKGRTGD